MLAIVGTALAWSPAGFFVQSASGGSLPMSAPTIAASRFVVALLALSPILILERRRLVQTLRMGASWLLACLMVGYYLASVTAFTLTTVAEGTLLVNTAPLFVLSIRLMRRDSVTRRELLGALLAFIGLCVILMPDIWGGVSTDGHLFGAGMALVAALIGALYSLIFARLAERGGVQPRPSVVTLLTFAVGVVVALPMMPTVEQWQGNLGALLALGIVVTAVPTFLYSVASSKLSAVVVTTFRLLTPIIATLLAVAFWDEVLGVWFWIGGALVLMGLFVIARPAD